MLVCTRCFAETEGRSGGGRVLWILLLVFGLGVGLLVAWPALGLAALAAIGMAVTGGARCTHCGGKELVPADSPRGKQIAGQRAESEPRPARAKGGRQVFENGTWHDVQ